MSDFADAAGCTALRAFSFLFSRMPLKTAVAVGRFLGHCSYFVSHRRRVAYADLKAALGSKLTEKKRREIVRRHFGHLGEMFAEVLRLPQFDKPTIERTVRFHEPDGKFRIVEEKRARILMTAHFGNWELLQIVAGILGRPLNILARNQKHPKMNAFLNSLRESHGSAAVPRGIGVRDLLRSLRRNEPIGLLGDLDAGKYGGLILPFFGRKTTVPIGAFEMSQRTGAPVYPVFIVRRNGENHEIFVEKEIRCEGSAPSAVSSAALQYLSCLEDFISRYPEQWLWESKRWKYSWTKRILILSDEKPGHVKQSLAVAAQFAKVTEQHGRPGMEYPTQVVPVHFKSSGHRVLFSIFAFFFLPFAQSRMGLLRGFFTEKSFSEIENASADFIISAGSSLVPLNLWLARENRAKSVVLMKPAFPFNLYRFDLAIVPAHDRGLVPSSAFRPMLTPSRLEPRDMEESADRIKKELRDSSRVRLAVFLGGPTRRFHMDLPEIKKLLAVLKKCAPNSGDYMITTSRRTPDEISDYLKQQKTAENSFQLLVIAKEDKRAHIVNGMMGLADILIVTEDSVSMISEAVSSGKKVIVLRFASGGLPEKHRRFKTLLEREAAVVLAGIDDLEEKITRLKNEPVAAIAEKENEALKKRLQEIL